MGACDDALRELRSIADRLSTLGELGNGNEQGPENEQINVVRLIQNSPCPVLKELAPYVQHDRPEQVLLAWQELVINGLEPTEPTLPKVAAIRSRTSAPVRVISTSEPPPSKGAPINLWVDHARRVVRVLIDRVARVIGGDDGEYQPATWFPKGMADRLRQAASTKRKTKRVATRMVDGVVCYSVADARRWWASEIPKEA